jgi:hypothetical protein
MRTIISHCDNTVIIIIIIIIIENSFTPKLHTEKTYGEVEKRTHLFLISALERERANYGSYGDNSANYDYDGNDDDDDDDENTIIPSVIFYSLHHCLETLDEDHSYCKSKNIRVVRHEKKNENVSYCWKLTIDLC